MTPRVESAVLWLYVLCVAAALVTAANAVSGSGAC